MPGGTGHGGGPARRSRRTAAWLVEAMAPGRAPGTWEADASGVPTDLCEAALQHGVEGWVRRRALQAGVPLGTLEPAVRGALARHLRATSDLSAAHDALTSAGVPFLVVKGPALVERLYSAPELRSYVDLDLLVRPRDLESSVEVLQDSGFRLLDANWPLLQRERVLELRMAGPSGGAVDLHWSLGKGPHAASGSPPVDVLLDRSESWEVAGRAVRSLDWADTLVHLAVHAAGSGGHRLLWCADLRAATTAAPNGATALLVQRAGEWQAAPQLHLMLSRSRAALGTPVPREWLDALAVPTSWTRLTAVVDRVFPIERQADGRNVARLVARSASATGAASWSAFVAKSLAALRSPRGPVDPEWLLDPNDPRSALHPVGDCAARRAFFTQVAEGPAPP